MLPGIWRIAVRLAVEYGVPYIRLADERQGRGGGPRPAVLLRNLPKRLILRCCTRRLRPDLQAAPVRTSDYVAGIGDSGAITAERLARLWAGARLGVTEIIVHPSLAGANGRRELDALLLVSRRRAAGGGVRLASFRQLAAEPYIPAGRRAGGVAPGPARCAPGGMAHTGDL
jgi:hypothetical protein